MNRKSQHTEDKARTVNDQEFEAGIKESVIRLMQAVRLKERKEIVGLIESAHLRCNRDNAEFENLIASIEARSI